ncbi:MAG TPA: hypothetical protein VLU96_11110 [Gaiellaceae bacterium]|nr:hypothetical protein [Gaiellaceae bacterium]
MEKSTLRALAIAGAVLLAALVAAVVVLARNGSGSGSAVGTSSLTVGVETPPAPPRDAVVLAREAGSRAVAIAVGPGARPTVTVTALAPSGGGLSGLRASVVSGDQVVDAPACGQGCYRATVPRSGRYEVRLSGSRPVVFALPESARVGTAILRRASRVFRALRSLVYIESLRSDPTTGIVTTWRQLAPNRLTYQIRDGAAAVVIGRRRWDQDTPGAAWVRSSQIPQLVVPQPSWGSVTSNAHVLAAASLHGRPVWVVSFLNPTIPAWFTAWIDRGSYRTLQLRMTAAAHFMFHRYVAFDQPLKIVPPP